MRKEPKNPHVKEAIEDYLGLEQMKATCPLPTRQAAETLDRYRGRVDKWRLERNRAKGLISGSDWPNADLTRILVQKSNPMLEISHAPKQRLQRLNAQ